DVTLDDERAREHDPEADRARPNVGREREDEEHQPAQQPEGGPADDAGRGPDQRRPGALLYETRAGAVELGLYLAQNFRLFAGQRHAAILAPPPTLNNAGPRLSSRSPRHRPPPTDRQHQPAGAPQGHPAPTDGRLWPVPRRRARRETPSSAP